MSRISPVLVAEAFLLKDKEILRLRAELAAGNEWLNARASVLEELALARAENENLRAALKQIAETYNKPTTSKDGLAFIAAAALKETE